MPEKQPNILLIHVDQWRGDCLGFLGHPVVETPHLDRLAQESTHFTQAYAEVPSCIASRASLMTGLKQRTHGRTGYQDRVPWTYDTTLAGTFADAGYHTQAVGKMHVFPARNLLGFHNVVLHDGFLHNERAHTQDLSLVDDYLPWLKDNYGQAADYIDTGMGCNGYVVSPWVYDQMAHPSAWITTQAVDFMRRRDPTKPFFLYVSYHRPHPPLDPPQAYLDLYENKELPPLVEGDWDDMMPPPNRGLDSPCPTEPTQRDRARRAYYAQMTFIDHQLNRLLHTLNSHNELDNTAIVFVADHGDMLYDHGMLAKAVPYDGSARVPFMVRLPKGCDVPRNTTVDPVVGMRDVFPTLCEIAGIPVPESVEGRSALPFAEGETAPWRDYLHGEHNWGEFSNQWITDGKYKYAWYSQIGVEQLFDLENDPQETHDLSQVQPELVAKYRQYLIDELTGREEGYVKDGKLVVGRPATAILSEAGLK